MSEELKRLLEQADAQGLAAWLARPGSPAALLTQEYPPLMMAVRVPGHDGHGEKIPPAQRRDFDRAAVVALLIKAGADVNFRNERRVTAMHMAARYNQPACLRELAKAGADVNAQDTKKETPLFRAANLGHLEAVEALLDLGADGSLANRERQQPIDQASKKRFREIEDLLSEEARGTSERRRRRTSR
jgi:ankyrin repeat protein